MSTEKTLEEYKILYRHLEEAYQSLSGKQKEWADNNWTSMMIKFADDLIESAESSTQESESEDESEDEDDDDNGEEWFNSKYPDASCHRCEKKLNGETVNYCGGGGGACETWYCEECKSEGTEDCPVCKED